MRKFVLCIAVFLAVSLPADAQETRVALEGQEPPAAAIEDVSWLVGLWVGEGIGGAPAAENWLPAYGNTMVGTFVQENSEGGVQFTEHMYLMEEEGSLVLKIKHFNPDLTGWEEKGDMDTSRLVSIEPCAAYFDGLTIRCDGEEGMLAAVRAGSKDGEIREYVFRYRRAKG